MSLSIAKRIKQAQEAVAANKVAYEIDIHVDGRPRRAEALRKGEWTDELIDNYIKRATRRLVTPDEIVLFRSQIKRALHSNSALKKFRVVGEKTSANIEIRAKFC